MLRYTRPKASFAAADLVLGQPTLTAGSNNACYPSPTPTASSMVCSDGVAVDRRGDLLVSDTDEDRVLRFDRVRERNGGESDDSAS